MALPVLKFPTNFVLSGKIVYITLADIYQAVTEIPYRQRAHKDNSMTGDINQTSYLLSIVNTVGEALYLSDEPQEILDLVLDKIMELLPIDCCWVHFLDEKSGSLNLLLKTLNA